MPLRFVDAATGAVVAEATIPAGLHEALLLFTATEAGSSGTKALRYQISVLDDGAGRQGPGGLAIINLSELALSGTVNSEKVTLKAGLNPTLAIGRSAKITLSTVFKNRSYQSYASTVSLGRNERALLILFPPFYKGGLEVQSRLLLDQPPVAPGTAAQSPQSKVIHVGSSRRLRGDLRPAIAAKILYTDRNDWSTGAFNFQESPLTNSND